MKIVYQGFPNNIHVRFGSNWHFSLEENIIFVYCFVFLLLLFFQNEYGIFMQDLQNIIPEKFDSNSPSNFRGDD